MRVTNAGRRLRMRLPRALLQGVRRLPVVEAEGLANGEIQTVLAALGTQPKTVFAAVVVERRGGLTRFDEFAIDEAEAAPAGADGAGHYPCLVLAGDCDAPAAR